MNVKEMKKLIHNLPDETEIEINSVWDEDIQELTPTECDGYYHEKDKKVYLTPGIIALPESDYGTDEEYDESDEDDVVVLFGPLKLDDEDFDEDEDECYE